MKRLTEEQKIIRKQELKEYHKAWKAEKKKDEEWNARYKEKARLYNAKRKEEVIQLRIKVAKLESQSVS